MDSFLCPQRTLPLTELMEPPEGRYCVRAPSGTLTLRYVAPHHKELAPQADLTWAPCTGQEEAKPRNKEVWPPPSFSGPRTLLKRHQGQQAFLQSYPAF